MNTMNAMSSCERHSDIMLSFIISVFVTAFILAATHYFAKVTTPTKTETGVLQWSSDTASWKGGW